MDPMHVIELHTTFAPRAGHLEPAAPTLTARRHQWASERQARFDERGLPRGLAVL